MGRQLSQEIDPSDSSHIFSLHTYARLRTWPAH
jgi:hypothetical protein